MEVFLGLGSNIGDRLQNLKIAMELLLKKKVIEEITCSSVYESQAVLLPRSPKEWELKYLNIVVKGHSAKTPEELLESVKSIEIEIGRVFRGKWAPREIDIDIIACSNLVYKSEELTIPHTSLLEREWVAVPLAEIAPGWKYPVSGGYYQMPILEIVRRLYEDTECIKKKGVLNV